MPPDLPPGGDAPTKFSALKAEGATPPEHHAAAYEAAMAAYLRLDPDAPADRLEASGIVSTMIAHAIRADTDWFWHGPDA